MGTPMGLQHSRSTSLRHRAIRLVVTAAAAIAFAVAPSFLFSAGSAQSPTDTVAQPCVNGVVPGNPYIVNCNLRPRPPRIMGSAPDAGAIIACRNWPGCLSWYVNGGP